MSTLNKYIWVVDTLYNAGERGLSLKELNAKWLRKDISNGEPIIRQTFNRWKDGILDTMGVVIECNLYDEYRYFISNPEVLQNGEVSKWMLDTYTTINSLQQNIAIKDRILLEEVPSSRNYLAEILTAIRENKIVEMTYQSFTSKETYTFNVAPYCLKMFQKRWYMLALSIDKNQLRIYALDRIHGIELTKRKFKLPKNFNAREYFAPYFGVIPSTDTPTEFIVLRAKGNQQNYLRSLPLHPSQKEVRTDKNGEYADFSLRLCPTFDFLMELSSHGGLIEVLTPPSLRHSMHEIAAAMWEMYKND